MADLAVTRGFDHGPSVRVGEQRLEHEGIQPMSAPAGAEGAENRRAGQSEIADRIDRRRILLTSQWFQIAMAMVLGPDSGVIVTVLALVCVGTIANLQVMEHVRTTYAMARKGMLPPALSTVSVSGTPGVIGPVSQR